MHDVTPELVDRSVFRSVMRKLASSVTVITTFYEGQPHGMTATAVCSVCAEPPTILIVVNRSARTHPLIDASGIFVVNILADDQRALGERFAGKMTDQFSGILYRPGQGGGPILEGTAAHLDCLVTSQTDVGTHTIFIGQVIGGDFGAARPLIYHEGAYATLAEPPADQG
jgi:flavin reductase (DIM6/NTAB) family NADH-FMN oxidoreductase RutF